MRILQRTAG